MIIFYGYRHDFTFFFFLNCLFVFVYGTDGDPGMGRHGFSLSIQPIQRKSEWKAFPYPCLPCQCRDRVLKGSKPQNCLAAWKDVVLACFFAEPFGNSTWKSKHATVWFDGQWQKKTASICIALPLLIWQDCRISPLPIFAHQVLPIPSWSLRSSCL